MNENEEGGIERVVNDLPKEKREELCMGVRPRSSLPAERKFFPERRVLLGLPQTG